MFKGAFVNLRTGLQEYRDLKYGKKIEPSTRPPRYRDPYANISLRGSYRDMNPNQTLSLSLNIEERAKQLEEMMSLPTAPPPNLTPEERQKVLEADEELRFQQAKLEVSVSSEAVEKMMQQRKSSSSAPRQSLNPKVNLNPHVEDQVNVRRARSTSSGPRTMGKGTPPGRNAERVRDSFKSKLSLSVESIPEEKEKEKKEISDKETPENVPAPKEQAKSKLTPVEQPASASNRPPEQFPVPTQPPPKFESYYSYHASASSKPANSTIRKNSWHQDLSWSWKLISSRQPSVVSCGKKKIY